MDYKITISQHTKEVEIGSSGRSDSDEYLVLFKDSNRKLTLLVLRGQDNTLIVSIDKKVYSIIQAERTASSVNFLANGRRITSTIGSFSKNQSTSSLIARASELVASNFPATVVKLLAKKGDALKEGDTLIVLEAMKMEAQIKAPKDCTVEEVLVKEGDMVGKGKTMIKLKFR